MIIRPRWLPHLAVGALVLSLPAFITAPAAAQQQTYVYPQRGQSPQQQQQDFTNCSNWAVQQSGFDPRDGRVTSPPPPPPQQRVIGSGAMARGAAGGAALGAVGGAIGGDAGKGAAIGAGVGALFGGMRRASEINQEQQVYQSQVAQQQAIIANGQANYDRAFAACMQSYGYSVR
jgi:hypothetical protein